MKNQKLKLTQEAWGEIRNALMLHNKGIIKSVRTFKSLILNDQKKLNAFAEERATKFTDEKLMAILKDKGVIENVSTRNIELLFGATIWHLNNMDKKGNPTTKMCIPNSVWIVLEKKLAQLPEDREITETEALEIVRKKK